MQLAQLYVGAWMAGGVLAGVMLLVCDFGRNPSTPFSPPLWVSALAGGLAWGGMAGIVSVGLMPHWGDRGSLIVAGAAALLGLTCGAWLQRRASRSAARAVSATAEKRSGGSVGKAPR